MLCVVFYNHLLFHSGSLLQDDPGCSSKDRLPQTSPAALHLLPSPAGGADQDERQWCQFLHLPHWHAQADQKQGATITSSYNQYSQVRFILPIIADWLVWPMESLLTDQQTCIFGRKRHSGRAQKVWWKPRSRCLLHVLDFLPGGWWTAGEDQTGEGVEMREINDRFQTYFLLLITLFPLFFFLTLSTNVTIFLLCLSFFKLFIFV